MPLYKKIANDVLKEVREKYKVSMKSSNKTYDKTLQKGSFTTSEGRLLSLNILNDRADKRIKGHDEVWEAVESRRLYLEKREQVRKKDMPAPTLSDYGQAAIDKNEWFGNCGELTWLCCAIASKRSDTKGAVWLVKLVFGCDHTFCVIGEGLKEHDGNFLKDILSDLTDSQDESLWVVDAWANITCKLSDYPELFANKMKDWLGEGKRIIVMENGKRKHVDPTEFGEDLLSSVIEIIESSDEFIYV